jgi:DNA polymerase-1
VAALRTAGEPPLVAVVGDGLAETGSLQEVVALVDRLERQQSPRWTWWSATDDARALVAARLPLARCWDVAEVHRLLAGGWHVTPQLAWARARGLDASALPAASAGDLFDFGGDVDDSGDPDDPVRPDGYLRPDAGSPAWPLTPERLVGWGRAALACAAAQEAALAEAGPRAVATAHSESAAALLCLELERDGLPLDRPVAEQLIADAAGPRPRDERHARAVRAERDAAVLRHTPGRESTDLRNPVQVRELLLSVGVDVPNTRKGVLAPFRDTHPLVEALLQWRTAERIATTYGYAWLEAHVGPDDRLRGTWSASDGAAGRMTAQNGLHNLPTSLRPAVAAHPGHVLVRADLGQIEPRVLAAVSGDPAFAAATRSDDLYAPVAKTLGVERAVAKVAVLGAMYGARRGTAADALKGLERAYPTAMAYLDRMYAAGVRRESLRTFGGRTVHTGGFSSSGQHGDSDPGDDPARAAARGRFARNAVIQGAAAELFKAWAATVRATTRDLGAQIVLCLHDELLVHVPARHAEEAQRRVVTALDDSARRWTGSTQVRFVADTSVVHRWSEAKE